MKTQQTKYLATLLLIITLINCSSDDNTPTNPIDQLPPITQNGTNKVGCLVNGEVFLPKGSNPFGPPIVTCFYQNINGSYEFGLGFNNNEQVPLVRRISLQTNKLEFSVGETYRLKSEQINNSAYAYFILGGGQFGYETTDTVVGELTITKLDTVNLIISGTFWFDAERVNNGEIIQIREGRFDMEYSP